MPKLPITLGVYETFKGHHSNNQIYKIAIEHLEKQMDMNIFNQRIVHIKHEEKDDTSEMESFFDKRKFEIVKSVGTFKHFEESHQRGYILDIIKVSQKITSPFFFHFECDWLLKPKKDLNVTELLVGACRILDDNPYLMSVRFPQCADEINRIKGIKEKHNLPITLGEVHDLYLTSSENTSHNPNLSRSKDYWFAGKMLDSIIKESSAPVHSEHTYSPIQRWMTPLEHHLACLNPTYVQAVHIGVKEEELKVILSENNIKRAE